VLLGLRTVFKDESIVVVALGEPGVPLIWWALTVTAPAERTGKSWPI